MNRELIISHPSMIFREFLLREEWDGIDRAEEFFKTITGESLQPDRVESYIEKFMKDVIDIAFNQGDKKRYGTLVLCGGDRAQKLEWIKGLVPFIYKAIGIRVTIRHNAYYEANSYLITEFNNFDRPAKEFKTEKGKVMVNRIKGLMEQSCDYIGRKGLSIPRKTIYCATAKDDSFMEKQRAGLNLDIHGPCRWMIIYCDQINFNHGMNMEQIWLEIYKKNHK